eukprot:6166662-Prymnesium_polylepis.1
MQRIRHAQHERAVDVAVEGEHTTSTSVARLEQIRMMRYSVQCGLQGEGQGVGQSGREGATDPRDGGGKKH